MSDLVIFHNPRCSTSRAALGEIADTGRVVIVWPYLRQPPTRDELLDLLSVLEDAPGDLVRRDTSFRRLGLSAADVESVEQVADVLSEHPELMQRPVLRYGSRAIIGRPKDRVPAFLAEIPTNGNEAS